MAAYLGIPNNYYILDGKNSRLLDIVQRREFERKTIDGNEGFVLQIPFLKCAFGAKYFVVDKQNGNMMGIFDDKVEMIKGEAQMKQMKSHDNYSRAKKTGKKGKEAHSESTSQGLPMNKTFPVNWVPRQ